MNNLEEDTVRANSVEGLTPAYYTLVTDIVTFLTLSSQIANTDTDTQRVKEDKKTKYLTYLTYPHCIDSQYSPLQRLAYFMSSLKLYLN